MGSTEISFILGQQYIPSIEGLVGSADLEKGMLILSFDFVIQKKMGRYESFSIKKK